MTSLYFHIPFCLKKCAYCDFVSEAGREADFSRYLARLESEIAETAKRLGRVPVSTLFFGGGTPSILPSDAVMHLIAMCRALFRVAEDAEITVEANPGAVSLAKLRDYRDAGVNRISLGVQSFSPRLLELLGRVHDGEQAVEAVSLSRQAGIENINLDLIYALPTQTMPEWIDTVKAALSLNVPHLSLYSLILEDGTPLTQKVVSGELPAPDDEAALAQRAAAGRMLGKRGLARYEISNYARPGFACRHNLTYWRRGDYLGFGCAAHSFYQGERFANTESIDGYLAGAGEVSRQRLTEKDAFEETVMLGTRMAEGVPLPVLRGKEAKIERLKALGLVETGKGRLRLTEKGMDVQNTVVVELITE